MHSANILVVIDSDGVKKAYPHPSTDCNNPTIISHDYQFLIVTGSRGRITGQATGDLAFNADVGDSVSFHGTSIYQNSDDAVIVYGITRLSGDEVFTSFIANEVVLNGAVHPNIHSSNGLPVVHNIGHFNTLDSSVKEVGKENFNVNFGIFILDPETLTQNLFGYFAWDPSISVSPEKRP